MTVESLLDPARERIQAERAAADEKLDAYDSFLDRLGEVSAGAPTPSLGTKTVVGDHRSGSGPSEGCRAVRTAFAETVDPHCDVDGLEAIRRELSDQVAVALSATTGPSLTPAVQRLVVSEAETRRAETAVLERALEREASQLDDAVGTVETIADWIVEAEGSPLTELGFDALAARHDRLDDFRADCSTLAADRQAFLRGTTSIDGETGLRHRCLVGDCYRALPVDHPVLATVARLEEVCRTCQRSVRSHLVRRA